MRDTVVSCTCILDIFSHLHHSCGLPTQFSIHLTPRNPQHFCHASCHAYMFVPRLILRALRAHCPPPPHLYTPRKFGLDWLALHCTHLSPDCYARWCPIYSDFRYFMSNDSDVHASLYMSLMSLTSRLINATDSDYFDCNFI